MKRNPKSKSSTTAANASGTKGSTAKRPKAKAGKARDFPTVAFAKANWSLKGLPIPREALASDAAVLLGALDRVRSYRAFLAQARAAKAAGHTPEIDRQVHAQARVVLSDTALATGAAARVLRVMHISGAFNHLTAAMSDSLKAGGPVKAQELWTQVRTTEACRPCMARNGITDAMLDEFGTAMARTDLMLASDGAGVIVEGTVDGKPVRRRMAARPRASGLPSHPMDLLTADRFLSLCDSLERGEPAYLLGAGPRREPPALEDLLLVEALLGQRESVRHVRKLEDAGLATHAGGEPATIVVILLAVAVVGAILVAAECGEEEQGLNNEPSSSCTLGILLLTLGTAVIIGLAVDDKQTQLNTLGGQNISGPLPQLQTPGF